MSASAADVDTAADAGRAASPARNGSGRTGAYLLLIILVFLTLYPLAMLLYGALSTAPPGELGSFDLRGFRELWNAATAKVLLDTLSLSVVKTTLGVALAVLLAWIVTRTDTPGRGTLEVLLSLPFFIPPILLAMGWSMLGNPTVGTINLWWNALTGAEEPLVNVFSFGGVVWHMIQFTVPFAFLLLVDAFRAMDPSLEESSRMSGASRMGTFFRITLILMLPIISNVFILSLIKGLEAFEGPLFFGLPAGIHVVTTEIYEAIHHRNVPDYQYATALSFSTMAVMCLVVAWQWRLLRGRRFETVTGKGYSPNVMKLGWLRWVTFGICAATFLIMTVMPVGQLIAGSLVEFYGFYSWDALTLKHYRAVFDNALLWRSTRNTLILAVGGATLTTILGSLISYVVVRTRWPIRYAIDLLAWLPWMMPGMVLGLGFLWGFALLPRGIDIYGTLWALLFAYMTLGTPLTVRIMSGAFTQLSVDLEECSRVHGANWWQTFRRILLSLTFPSFAVGWVLTFFMILRELSASVLLYSVGNEVMPVVILRMWEEGKAEEVSVVALFMLLLVLAFRVMQLIIVKRRFGGLQH
ncbi:MAG: iron ABC transporter permease [Burkholderiales bacterium]|nr:iron ABC transporter permease [Burkholderiales bacterium]ODU68554.1 MAG: ABC transporter permease [Lautropia sp. SCN 66-9]